MVPRSDSRPVVNLTTTSTIFTMDDNKPDQSARPKRLRESKPKVRTGCLTCKTRRVKCDETRPECLRCQKAGRKCNGYATTLRGPPRQLAPRMQVLCTQPQSQLIRVSSSFIPRSPSAALFQDETEARYFQLYCTRTATKLGGYWDGRIWKQLILQACHQEPFARHAIVSIGALDKAMEYPMPRGRAPTPNHDENADNAHHQFALREYGKALRLMRESSSEDEEHHVRRALISCLLIICFETFRGDPDLALIQARTAVKVLSQWLRNIQFKGRPHTSGIAPLRTYVVEDDLVNAFARLYKGILVFRVPRPTDFHTLLMPEATEKLRHMPSTFSTLEEAKEYWELHLRCALPWNYTPGHDALTASAFPKVWPDVIRDQDQQRLSAPQDDMKTVLLEEERAVHILNLEKWAAAFEPVWQYCHTVEGADDFSVASILRMQSLCGVIAFAAAGVSQENIYDEFNDKFGEMTSLARNILEISEGTKPEGANSFSFTSGVVTSMYFVVMKCRDRMLRREILRLFQKYPRREGVWDSEMVAAVGKWVMGKEEKGLKVGEIIPESARLRIMDVKIPSAKRRAILRYTLMEGSPRERVMFPAETITW